MGARWYQPSSATFLTRDTYAGELQTPFSLNRYTYALNNPTRYWDPTGFRPEPLSVLRQMSYDRGRRAATAAARVTRSRTARQAAQADRNPWKVERYSIPARIDDGRIIGANRSTPYYKVSGVPPTSPASVAVLDAFVRNLRATNPGVLVVDFSRPTNTVISEPSDGSQIFNKSQFSDFSMSDALGGGFDSVKDSLSDFWGILGLAAELGSCVTDSGCEILDQAEDLVVMVRDIVANSDFDKVFEIVESFLPERCQLDTFELDYCLGYAVTGVVVSAVTGSGSAYLSRLTRLDQLKPKGIPGPSCLSPSMDWASARTTTAYNLTVEDIHTYFVEVGGEPVLVHNQCGELLSVESQIAQRLGFSTREIKDAIHRLKPNIPTGGPVRNPDVVVDVLTGEVYP